MTAFFFCLKRNGNPLHEREVQPMMEAIAHFGRDDKHLVMLNDFAIGVQGFWATPEDKGTRQPLYDANTQTWLVFHGRVDNRNRIFDYLERPYDTNLSDSELILLLYKQSGMKGLSLIVGPMVLFLFNEQSKKVIAVRDFTGSRYLVYHVSSKYLIFASATSAILAHPAVSRNLNEQFLVHKFAFVSPTKMDTLIQGVQQVKPGHLIEFKQQQISEKVFYLPDPERRITLESDQAYAEEFRRLLDQSVKRRLRSNRHVGSMLSGGLDSIPMTISAAQQSTKPIHTFTWVFDQYAKSDERQYIDELIEQINISAHFVPCDQAWFDIQENPDINILQPFHTPYLAFLYETYTQVEQQNVDVLLSGIGGDLLYCGDITIIWELLQSGQFSNLYTESRHRVKAIGGVNNFIKTYLIKSTRWFQAIRPWLASANLVTKGGPEWLTDYAASQIDLTEHWLDPYAKKALRPIQYRNLLGGLDANDAAGGRLLDIKFGFEKRYPFRDQDLLEFMLAIPSKQLFFNGEFRPIIKQAFKAELPDSVYRRNTKTDFFPVIKPKIEQSSRVDAYIKSSHSDWYRYVKKSYIDQNQADNALHTMLKWNCAYYEAWKEKCYY